MLRLSFASGSLLLLFISCNNRHPTSLSLSTKYTDGISFFFKKANSSSDADSALYWAGKAYNLSAEFKDELWIAKTQLVFSRLYRSKHELAMGKANVEKAVAGLERYGSKEDLGDALFEQVRYFNNTDYTDSNIVTQIAIIEHAGRLFRETGDSEKYAEALWKMGTLYNMRGVDSSQRVLDTLKKAVSIYKGGRGSQYVYNAMALQYAKDGTFAQAVDFGKRAVNTAEQFNDTTEDVGQLYDNLGLYYYNLKQYSQSIPYLKKAIAFDRKKNDTIGLLDCSQAIISAYYLSHEYNKAIEVLEETEKNCKLSNADALIPLTGIGLICYAMAGKQELAKLYLVKLLQYSSEHGKLDQSQGYVYNYLILYYLHLSQYRAAEKYCIINDTFTRFYRIPRIIASNYGWWASADSGLGHFEAAFDHLKKKIKISDTLFNGESRKQLNEFEIKYETEKKEQNIELLTKQSRLQEATLQNTKFTKNVILGAAGMLVLMLGLGYNRYRLKQRSNRKLELKQEEINKKNESLNQLVKDKEWLVKEMHHRVKNNLQVVMSLLNTQSMYLDNKAAQAAIRESQHRMHTISLIHQKLYQSDNSAMVSMPAYVCELTDYLSESLDAGAKVHFEKNIENLDLDVAQAIPVGLILNEAITNAIKYAFPGNEKGIIAVSMTRNKMQDISLIITDNGVGLKRDDAADKTGSLGMSLMDGLANQLGGVIKKTNDHGFVIKVVFPDMKDINIG